MRFVPLLRAALAPVWLAQGLHVALNTPRLPEAAGPRSGRVAGGGLRLLILGDSSAAGVGVATQAQALSGQLVAALGTELAKTPVRGLDWRLKARTGMTTAGMVKWLQTDLVGPADVAVVALGVNDLTRGVPLRRWLGQQRDLAEFLVSKLGVRHIYVSGVPPMGQFPRLPRPLRDVLDARARRFDMALAAQVATAGGESGLEYGLEPGVGSVIRYVRFDAGRLHASMMASDGFHPGAEIYADWAQQMCLAILSDLAP